MNICPNCGAQGPDNARFCNNCGAGFRMPAYGHAQTPYKKKLAFWWVAAIVFGGCILVSACIFLLAGHAYPAGDTQHAIAEPDVQVVPYTPDPGRDYSAAGMEIPTDEPVEPAAQTPKPVAGGITASAPLSEEDAVLLELVQGMWVSEVDFEGCCIRLLIHDDVAAMAVANPKTEGAEPRAWKDEDWDSDPWGWGDCFMEDGILFITDTEEQVPFKIYPISDGSFSMEYNYSETEEGDRVTFHSIQPPEEFNLSDFLAGEWVSDGTIKSDRTIHGLFRFGADGNGEAGRVKKTEDATIYDYESVYDFAYSTNGMALTVFNKNEGTAVYDVTILDAFTITFGDETFRRIVYSEP